MDDLGILIKMANSRCHFRLILFGMTLSIAFSSLIYPQTENPQPNLYIQFPVVPVQVIFESARFKWMNNHGSIPRDLLEIEGFIKDNSDELSLRGEIILPGVLLDTPKNGLAIGLNWLWTDLPGRNFNIRVFAKNIGSKEYQPVGFDEGLGLLLAEPTPSDTNQPPSGTLIATSDLNKSGKGDCWICLTGEHSFRLVSAVKKRIGSKVQLSIGPSTREVTPLLSPFFSNKGDFEGFCSPVGETDQPGLYWWITSKNEIEKRLQFIAANHSNLPSGYLGVFFADSPVNRGVMIRKTVPYSPAQIAGFQSGDLIIQINDIPVNTSRQLLYILSQNPPNSTVKFVVKRGDAQNNLSVVLGYSPLNRSPFSGMTSPWLGDESSRQITSKKGFPPKFSETAEPTPSMGVFIKDIPYQIKRIIGWQGEGGVLVAYVMRGSPAEQSGIHSGDLILEINEKTIRSVADVTSIITGMKKGQSIVLKYFHNDSLRNVKITLR